MLRHRSDSKLARCSLKCRLDAEIITISFLLLTIKLNSASAAPMPPPSSKVTIDLSYDFDNGTIYWPTAKSFYHDQVFRGQTQRDFYYEANNFGAAEHGGTHMDAPTHFCDPDNSPGKMAKIYIEMREVAFDVYIIRV